LIVIDIDHEDIYDEAKSIIPYDTLVVNSSQGKEYKKHYYFYFDDTKSYKCKNKAGEMLLEIRGKSSRSTYNMVLAPGSMHPETKKIYKIVHDNPIKALTQSEYSMILNIINKYNYKQEKKIHTKDGYNGRSEFKEINNTANSNDCSVENGLITNNSGKNDCSFHTYNDPIDQFEDYLAGKGYNPGGIFPDGKIHRFSTKVDDYSDKAGWYVLYDNGDDFFTGSYGDFRTGYTEN
jgi:hypothetical protein